MRSLLFAAVAVTGCYAHQSLDRNAPGRTDVMTAPSGRVEAPEDLGRQGLLLSAGLFGGLGYASTPAKDWHGAKELGVEASVGYFRVPPGREREDRLPPVTGLNVGAALFGDTPQRRAIYLEIQHVRDLAGLAGGWTWAPSTNAHGPQATAFYGPLYLRGDYLFGQGGAVQIGLMVKAYDKVSWFR